MSTDPNPGDLRVWHIPQVPGKPYYVPVGSVDEGIRVCVLLAEYDLFQYKEKIKPDYTNVQGIERYEWIGEGYEWCEVDLEFEEIG